MGKILQMLENVKDPVPDGLRSRVVCKFVCAGSNICYVGETCRHFSTRVNSLVILGFSHQKCPENKVLERGPGRGSDIFA